MPQLNLLPIKDAPLDTPLLGVDTETLRTAIIEICIFRDERVITTYGTGDPLENPTHYLEGSDILEVIKELG